MVDHEQEIGRVNHSIHIQMREILEFLIPWAR